MKKIIIIITVIILCIVFSCKDSNGYDKSNSTSYKVKWSDLDNRLKLHYTEKFLSILLAPYIQNEINEYYGKFKQYTNFQITEIEEVGYDNFVSLVVLSFTGAHNPPFGREIFKFQIGYETDDDNDCQVKLIEYKHEDVKN